MQFSRRQEPVQLRPRLEAVRTKLRPGGYDLVHAQFGQSARLALPKRLPLVITIRGDDVEGIVGKDGRYTVAGYILRILTRWLAKRADALILVSSHMQRHFPHMRADVIPSGLDLELFDTLPQREARQRLGLPPSKRLVLFVGNPDDPGNGSACLKKPLPNSIRRLRLKW